MTSVSAGHIILTPTQPVGNGRPQRGSNPRPPYPESRALPTELPPESLGKRKRLTPFTYANQFQLLSNNYSCTSTVHTRYNPNTGFPTHVFTGIQALLFSNIYTWQVLVLYTAWIDGFGLQEMRPGSSTASELSPHKVSRKHWETLNEPRSNATARLIGRD